MPHILTHDGITGARRRREAQSGILSNNATCPNAFGPRSGHFASRGGGEILALEQATKVLLPFETFHEVGQNVKAASSIGASTSYGWISTNS